MPSSCSTDPDQGAKEQGSETRLTNSRHVCGVGSLVVIQVASLLAFLVIGDVDVSETPKGGGERKESTAGIPTQEINSHAVKLRGAGFELQVTRAASRPPVRHRHPCINDTNKGQSWARYPIKAPGDWSTP